MAAELDFRRMPADLGDGAALVATMVEEMRQPQAHGLYLSEGYTPVPNFNGNPVATFFGEKRLSG